MTRRVSQSHAHTLLTLVLAAAAVTCGTGDQGAQGPAGAAGAAGAAGPGTSTGDGGSSAARTCVMPSKTISKWDTLPGVRVEITSIDGGTGPGGTFKAGDTFTVSFRVTAGDGCTIPLASLDGIPVWFSGPTTNYQHVLPADRARPTYDDVAKRAVSNADGTYSYTFADPIPATYGPPLHDTTKFTDRELTGQPLQDGTYTLVMSAFRNYTEGASVQTDTSTAIQHVPVGATTRLITREVVKTANCNQCHVVNQRHGNVYRDVAVCATCHTAGAEDGDSTDANDPTPQTLELGVMVHKIHSGRHLPSVLGIRTNDDGSRNYGAKPVPYVIGSQRKDYSFAGYPREPAHRVAMPRDLGYSALTTAQQAVDNQTRLGVVDCASCHGDPDGQGPLTAPANGDNAYTKPTRARCGSCHDDVDWGKPYVANGTQHPAQADDTGCANANCHTPSGNPFAVKEGHLHPLTDSALNSGVHVRLVSFNEVGNGNGSVDPGEKVSVSFTVKDDSGADIPAANLKGLSFAMNGPTTNRNLLLSGSFPLAAIGAGPTYALNLPMKVVLEAAGMAADDATVESFSTARTPHWNVTSATTDVYERTTTSGGNSTLAAAAVAGQNFVDVASVAGFARSDYLVLEDGSASKEFQQILLVDGGRLWVGAPLKFAHAAAVTAKEVTLVKKTLGTDLSLNAATGTLTEVAAGSIAAGHDVVVSYTTDFVMPAVYPPALNDSPDITETWGEWTGKSIVPGTYTFGLWASRTLVANASWGNDSTSYTAGSTTATIEVLVGGATNVVHAPGVSSSDSCNRCHADIMYHSSRRGLENCLLCHGNAGAEDTAQYSAAAAPATKKVTVNFRSLLHKLHMGRQLPDAATYVIVGGSSNAYPNNYSTTSFQNNWFPAKPSGTKVCTVCHLTDTTWIVPADRAHPTQQNAPVQAWRVGCDGCHSSAAAQAHYDETTTGGNEACAVCHGPSADSSVQIGHKQW